MEVVHQKKACSKLHVQEPCVAGVRGGRCLCLALSWTDNVFRKSEQPALSEHAGAIFINVFFSVRLLSKQLLDSGRNIEWDLAASCGQM